MNSKLSGKLRINHILIGLQVVILLLVPCSWLLHRSDVYNRNFTADDYSLSEAAKVDDGVSADASGEGEGVLLSTLPISLKKGTYLIQVDFSVDQPGSSISATSSLGPVEMRCPTIELDPHSLTESTLLELSRDADDVSVHISFSGNGQIHISNVGIHETSYLYRKNFCYAILLCLFINLGYFFLCSKIRIRKILLAMACIFLVSCYPLYNDFLIVGHDLPFHLLRIDAISQGLSYGTFPVKLHPLWANEYGYAIGIFYGDALLYFPALLRLMGFSIQASYKFFVAFINLGTILLCYYSFRKMFFSEKIALLGCASYTLAPYRLMNLYTRAAVGEYCALLCFPLILCGFYMMFQNSKRENWWKHAILTAFGLSGIIQSHVLSILITGFLIILTCLFLIRRVFQKYVFRSLALAAVLTVLLNLNFIVPFLDFYGEDIMIHSPDWVGSIIDSFQAGGLFPIQLFTLFQHSNGGAWPTTAGISNEPTFGIGILLTIGLFLFVYLLGIHYGDCKKNRNHAPAIVCVLLSCLALYMSTCYFPWDALISSSDAVKSIVYNLEFPWRMLAPPTALLTFVLCYAFDTAQKSLEKHWGCLIAASLVLAAVNFGWYFYDYSFSGEPYRVYTTSELYTMQMYSYEYVPSGTDPAALQENLIHAEGISPLEGYQKQGTTVSCTVSAQAPDAHIEFPLLYYKHYQCIDTSTRQRLTVCAGTNNMVRVMLPEGYSGSIRVSFVEPWFWRLAEAVSALAWIGVCFALYRTRDRKVKLRIVQKI